METYMIQIVLEDEDGQMSMINFMAEDTETAIRQRAFGEINEMDDVIIIRVFDKHNKMVCQFARAYPVNN